MDNGALVAARRFCVAPMIDWTDRHCRYFHRQLSRHAYLYTEMISTGALMHGSIARHLDFDPSENPVALQVGGSDPAELATVARLAQRWGYSEVNLNCGCPSERVQRGSFGACLMAEPRLVADCVSAMKDSVALPITVKHRIGIDRNDDYGFVRDFVGTVAAAGCVSFIVHARSAWLEGLSPRENREIPPLRYEFAYRLKTEFPELEFILNGGLTDFADIEHSLPNVDGVMLGRQAYHNPYLLAEVDRRLYGSSSASPTREEIVTRMIEYIDRMRSEQRSAPVHLRHVVRHMLGLYQGCRGARAWRRLLSDAAQLAHNDSRLLERARVFVEAREAA